MRKTSKLIAGFSFIIFMFATCRRDFSREISIVPINETEVKAWLHKEGMSYKNETLSVRTEDGQLLKGRLSWRQAKQYNWQGRSYIDIPFVFEQYGTRLPKTASLAPAGFNLVIRKTAADTYEGALRTIAYNATTEEEDGTSGNKTLQSYQLITGSQANIWQSNEDLSQPKPAYKKNITAQQFAQMKQAFIKKAGSTIARSAIQFCNTEHVVTYSGNCNYSVGEMVYVVLCRHDHYITTCETYEIGDGSSGGGGGPAPYPPAPAPENPETEQPKPDPCAEAKKASEALKTALADPKVKEQLEKCIRDYKNATNEYGFAIIKTATGFEVTAIQTSGSSMGVTITTDASANVVAIVHTHPPSSSAIHSSTDIYGLGGYTNSTAFVGNVVIHGDDIHLLSINDAARYNAFLKDKDKYYDKDATYGWKKKSKIDDEFEEFSQDYMDTPGYNYGSDATFPTQLYLMNKFKMGVGLQKYDMAANSFSLLETEAVYNNSTGSTTTIGGGGNVKNSPYESVSVKTKDCPQ